MTKEECAREACMFRDGDGACGFETITGRPRDCSVVGCDQIIEKPEAEEEL